MIAPPLVLISQIQRSGGTLLSQLLEGHPECAPYPHELDIGRPNKWDWPELPLEQTPATWFGLLLDKRLKRMAHAGYAKSGKNPFARSQVLRFAFDVDLLESRFLEVCERTPARSQRDVLDHYFRVFFETWADRRSTGEERAIVGFTPRVQMVPASLARYWRDYPDGRMISMIRDPLTWFASASTHEEDDYGDVERAIELWRASADASMRLMAEAPDSSLVVLFEDLVGDPVLVMHEVARFLGIKWHDCLLRPTYCGHLMIANSSFALPDAGLSTDPLSRPINVPAHARSFIAERAEPFYRACVARLRAADADQSLTA